MRILLVALIALGCLSACAGASSKSDPVPAQSEESISELAPEPEPNDEETPLQKLRKDIQTLEAKPEVQADEIQVQHLLVAHKDAGIPGVTRSKEEAEALTADLWQQIKKGADFDSLIKKHTNDSPPGIYAMTMTGEGNGRTLFKRTGMVAAFGDVGWRLQVGEYGVAPYEARKSPYGWHIIKRLK